MRRIALLAVALGGCAAVAPLPGPPLRGKCSTARLEEFVGKTLTVDLIHEAMVRAGVKDSRGIRPGQAVTMDYRADRLNIYTDAKGSIERFSCG
ncbi:MAG: I78 family peptidase inhibitor [Sphingomonas sp.]